jgi:methanogenic corrinoid protein MtbC1
MMTPNPQAAQFIESNAASIAAAACNRFIGRLPETDPAGSMDLYGSWSQHFQQRVLELSAAVATGQPAMFTKRVEWSRQAMAARYLESISMRETLEWLRRVLEDMVPEDSRLEALMCLDEAIKDYSKEPAKPEVSHLDAAQPAERAALFYLQAALEGNVREAMKIVTDEIEAGMDPRTAIVDVLLAAQREVGHLWHLDQITIAEEHVVTTTTQRLMAVIASRARTAPDNGKTAVTAAVAGNAHDIAVRAISYLLEMDGWRVINLGPDVPRDNLPAAIHFYDADITMLSLTLSSQLASLRETVEKIHAMPDYDNKVIVGGNAFRDAPDAWQTTGADGYASSASEALKIARQLASL